MVQLFVYMGNEDGLSYSTSWVAGKEEQGLAGIKTGEQFNTDFCPSVEDRAWEWGDLY